MAIILSTSTQKILNRAQKLQNKILKIIKFYPLRTKSSEIHNDLGIETIHTRTEKLFQKYLLSRLNNDLIHEEYTTYLEEEELDLTHKRFPTLFDKLSNFLN